MMAAPRLSQAQRFALYSVCIGTRTTTARWRDYLPLSKRGLVEILDSGKEFGALFGVNTRDVEPTKKGRAVARELVQSDLDAWKIAAEHAENGRVRFPHRRMCMCGPCVAVCGAWCAAGHVWPRGET